MHAVRIDRTKPLAAEPNTGHNRYHPDIAPLLEVGEGEEVSLETRDGVDGQITTLADLAKLDAGRIHPLTGPVFVKGAEPGDTGAGSACAMRSCGRTRVVRARLALK